MHNLHYLYAKIVILGLLLCNSILLSGQDSIKSVIAKFTSENIQLDGELK